MTVPLSQGGFSLTGPDPFPKSRNSSLGRMLASRCNQRRIRIDAGKAHPRSRGSARAYRHRLQVPGADTVLVPEVSGGASVCDGAPVEVQSAQGVQPGGFTPELLVGASTGGLDVNGYGDAFWRVERGWSGRGVSGNGKCGGGESGGEQCAQRDPCFSCGMVMHGGLLHEACDDARTVRRPGRDPVAEIAWSVEARLTKSVNCAQRGSHPKLNRRCEASM